MDVLLITQIVNIIVHLVYELTIVQFLVIQNDFLTQPSTLLLSRCVYLQFLVI